MSSEEHRLTPLQQAILNLYKELKEVLDRHGFRYYAIGGTLIGAVRHHGFIPWDDDMDLTMPDADYARFVKEAEDILPSHLQMLVRSDHPHDPTVAGRVFDKNTSFIERHERNYPDEYKGNFVDILPMSGIPADPKERERFFAKTRRYIRLNEKRRCSFFYLDRPRSKALWLAAAPLRVLPIDHWSEKLYAMQAKYPFDSAEMTGYTWELYLNRAVYPTSAFAEWIELPYEDTVIRCPKGYDAILRSVYGDYMQLPPKEKQIGMHLGTSLIDLERPYTYYQKMYREQGTIKKESE